MSDWGPFSLTGRHAIVTGGAMGIGFGIVRRFVQAGADVLLVDLDEPALRVAAEQLARAEGKVETLAADVADDDAGERMAARCVEVFGSLDILVNNAGIFPQAPVLAMSAEFLDRVLRVNLRGLVLASKAAGRQMVAQVAAAESSTSPRWTRCTPRWSAWPPTTPARVACGCSPAASRWRWRRAACGSTRSRRVGCAPKAPAARRRSASCPVRLRHPGRPVCPGLTRPGCHGQHGTLGPSP